MMNRRYTSLVQTQCSMIFIFCIIENAIPYEIDEVSNVITWVKGGVSKILFYCRCCSCQLKHKCILDNSLKQLRTKKQRNIKLPTHRMRFQNMMDLHNSTIIQKISKLKDIMTLFRASISTECFTYALLQGNGKGLE